MYLIILQNLNERKYGLRRYKLNQRDVNGGAIGFEPPTFNLQRCAAISLGPRQHHMSSHYRRSDVVRCLSHPVVVYSCSATARRRHSSRLCNHKFVSETRARRCVRLSASAYREVPDGRVGQVGRPIGPCGWPGGPVGRVDQTGEAGRVGVCCVQNVV